MELSRWLPLMPFGAARFEVRADRHRPAVPAQGDRAAELVELFRVRSLEIDLLRPRRTVAATNRYTAPASSAELSFWLPLITCAALSSFGAPTASEFAVAAQVQPGCRTSRPCRRWMP